MHVVYLDHCALHSGAELALARLLPALLATQPTVILAEHGPLVETLRDLDVQVEVLAMRERSRSLRRSGVVPGFAAARGVVDTWSYARQVARRIRELGAELVVTNSLKAALYGGVAGRLAGVPVVWHVHDRVAPDYLPAPAVLLGRWAARVLPSAIVANSASTLGSLELSDRARRRLISAVIGNACPTVCALDPEVVAPDSPLRVGIVGRLAPWKGQDVFLRAFASAFEGGDERAVVIGGALFGEEDFGRELQRLARELGVESRVRFAGHVEDVPSELAGLDILVHASTIPEPFGQVVVEAMAAGVPVIAADAGGPAEIVTDGEDGMLYRPADVAELVDRLQRLGRDTGLRRRLAANGRRSALRFAPPVVAREMEQVYRDVLDQHDRRAGRISRRG